MTRALHAFHGQSIARLLASRAASRGDAPFLIFAPFEGEAQRFTYAAFVEQVARVAGGLAHRGVRRGDRVLIFTENCPEALLAFLACAWIGAVGVPVNASLTASELSRLVARTLPRGIVTQPKLLEVALQASRDPWIAVTATDCGASPAACPPADARFGALLKPPIAAVAVGLADPAGILFTSGTTAQPKGVVWTQANLLWGAKLGALQEGLQSDDVHHVFLPLFHVVALTWSILPTLWSGGCAVLQPKFSASHFWPVAQRHRCTWASMVPAVSAILARNAVPETHAFRMWGHAFASPAYEARFRIPRFLGWWGMTEIVTQGIVGDRAFAQTPGSIGFASIGYDTAVVDDEGRPTTVDTPGELRLKGVRGVSLFAEYLDDAEATRAAFDDDGFFRTGDRVVVEADGAMRFVDRIKDVIRVGGESVAAPEIERVIAGVAGVCEVAVVARRDDVLGEVPVAFVLPDGANANPQLVDAVLAACRADLARFKVPREVRLVEAFPRVAIGKIAKAALREELAVGTASPSGPVLPNRSPE